MIDALLRTLKDFWHPKVLLLSFIPLLLSAALLGAIFYLLHTQIEDYFVIIAGYIPFLSEEWVQKISESFIALFIFYEFWIMLSLIFVGVIADRIVDFVNERGYHLKKEGFGTMWGSILQALKSNLLFFVLFIFSLPLLLIPVVNIAIHLLLWMVMLKAPMYYDAAAFYATKEEFKKIKTSYKGELRLITLLSAALLFIPFIGVLLYIFQLMLYTHFALTKLHHIRSL
jgi:hypothetical protein